MTVRVDIARAEAHLAELVAGIAAGRGRVILEQGGQPVAALVSLDELERLGGSDAATTKRGALALVGAWGAIIDDGDIDAMVEHLYEQRESDAGRSVVLPDE